MKKHLLPTLLALLGMFPLTGCTFATHWGPTTSPTAGQQLIDLQKAKDVGAITPEQYEAKKAALLKE